MPLCLKCRSPSGEHSEVRVPSHHLSGPHPQLVNWEEVQALLRRHAARHGAQARTVTLSTDAPFASHLDTLAASSVVVARHGPLLGTAALMAPGEWGAVRSM